jgi:general secretion pathway protein A
MYQDYFGIEENPFSLTPDPRYLYMARGHQEALAHLLYGVSEGGGFVMLTGEVGTGKTSVCRCLLEQLPDEAQVALILNPRQSEVELLSNICDELGIGAPAADSVKTLVDRLNQHLLSLHAEGRHAVLIIDEAQNLSPAVMEQVRLLTNLETDKRKLLQIIFIGQPELGDLLNRKDLRQLAQRISARFHLDPLSAAEARDYIAHRLAVGGIGHEVFTAGARAEIYKHSRGVPRLINSLCDRCLLAAYVQETRQIDRKIVRAAASEVLGRRTQRPPRRRAVLPWAVATAAVAVAVIALAVPRDFGDTKVVRSFASVAEPAATPAASETAAAVPDTKPVEAPAESPPIATSTALAAVVSPESAPEPVATSIADGEPEIAVAEAPPVDQAAESVQLGVVEPATVTTVEPNPPVEAVETVQQSAALPMAEATAEPAPTVEAVESAQQSTALPVAGVAADPSPLDPAVENAGQMAALPAPGAGEDPSPADQAAPVAEPKTLLTLDELFAAKDLADSRTAGFERLFAFWQQDFDAVAGSEPCDKALQAKLQCLEGHGSLKTLADLGRPALLPLNRPDGGRIDVVVTGLDGVWAMLEAGPHKLRVRAADVAAAWSGDFVVLWRPPAVYHRLVALGQSGADVVWLKNRLAELDGEPADEAAEATFDADLEARVVAFQRSRPLRVDGIVGPRTLMQLNSALGTPGIAVLSAAEP